MPNNPMTVDLRQPYEGQTVKTGSELGTIFGESTDKLGFYGRTPIGQQPRIFLPVGTLMNTGSKVGLTSTGAPWVSGAAADLHAITLTNGATAATATIPLTGLRVGDIITGFGPVGQIENTADNTIAFDLALHSMTVAAADPTVSAALAAIGQITTAGTADIALSYATHGKKDIAITVERNKTYFFLITGTTGAASDIALQGVYVEVVRNRAAETYWAFTSRPKIGADSGFSVTTAVDSHPAATLAASDTAASLVFPLSGLHVGSVIKSVAVLGQIEVGTTPATTLSGALYKIVATLGGNVTSLVKNLPSISTTASTDVALDATNMGWACTGNEDDPGITVAAGEHYFVLLNAVTVANSDIQIMGIEALIRDGASNRTRLATNMKKVGATAGWSANPAENTDESTENGTSTTVTLVIPVSGLRVGDRITSFWPVGQITSEGTVSATLVTDLRKLTSAAAENTDALVKTSTTGALSVPTVLGTAHAAATTAIDAVAADESFYFLLTLTADADTTTGLIGVGYTVEADPTEALVDAMTKLGLVASS